MHAPFWSLIDGASQCPVCLKEYWLPARLVQHLQFSTTVCGEKLRNCAHIVPSTSATTGPRAAASRDWKSTLPATRAEGPLQQWFV